MEIEFCHWNDLRVTPTGRTALDTECRALTRLSNTRDRDLMEMSANSLRESNGGGRLSLAQRSRSNPSNDNVLSVLP